MVRDKNGKKVKIAKLDIPELAWPEGMTEEEMERSSFNTEDEYQDYLWQQEHGVPVGMPVDEIERYIRSRRLNNQTGDK